MMTKLRCDNYTAEMAEKLICKMRADPESVFNALGRLESVGREMAERERAAGNTRMAIALSDACRAINVVREWCPGW